MREYVIGALHHGHTMMKHVLTLLRLHLDMLAPTERAHPFEFQFLQNAIGYMHLYPGLVHHPAEELILERLLHYQPRTEPLRERLGEEHGIFKVMETSMMERLAGAKGDDLDRIESIKEIGIAYCLTHADHIEAEEAEALPQAIKWLKPADWAAIRAKSRFHLDPLNDRAILIGYDNIYDFLMDERANFTRH